MKCEDFRSWLEREGFVAGGGPAESHGGMPENVAGHYRSCPECRSLLKEEVFWKRFFAAAPEPVLRESLWPGVMARIRERLDQSESFSEVLLLWARRLAPAFALTAVRARPLHLSRQVTQLHRERGGPAARGYSMCVASPVAR